MVIFKKVIIDFLGFCHVSLMEVVLIAWPVKLKMLSGTKTQQQQLSQLNKTMKFTTTRMQAETDSIKYWQSFFARVLDDPNCLFLSYSFFLICLHMPLALQGISDISAEKDERHG